VEDASAVIHADEDVREIGKGVDEELPWDVVELAVGDGRDSDLTRRVLADEAELAEGVPWGVAQPRGRPSRDEGRTGLESDGRGVALDDGSGGAFDEDVETDIEFATRYDADAGVEVEGPGDEEDLPENARGNVLEEGVARDVVVEEEVADLVLESGSEIFEDRSLVDGRPLGLRVAG